MVPRVTAHLVGTIEDVTLAEDEIVTRVASGTSDAKINGMRIIAAKKGNSIVLYVWCEKVEELLRLEGLKTSGHLQESIEQLFNQLLNRSEKIAVKEIKMDDEELERMKEYFTGDQLFTF